MSAATLDHLRIGTRGSRLALWQAEHVRELLRARAPGIEVEIVPIRSSGEEHPERSFPEIGAGVFTREIDAAVLDGRADLGVHSLKDVPTRLPEGLVLAAVPERGDPLDAWVAAGGTRLDALPEGARIGTSSPRRSAQLRHRRPDLEVTPLRGNVETRLRKLETLGLAGTVLAAAGLRRLGLADRITEVIPADCILPAVGQGALAIVARGDRGDLLGLLGGLEHAPSRARAEAERAFLETLRGGCQVPAGALARLDGAGGGAGLVIEGVLCAPDGSLCLRGQARGRADEAAAAGRRLAGELIARGGAAILEQARGGAG